MLQHNSITAKMRRAPVDAVRKTFKSAGDRHLNFKRFIIAQSNSTAFFCGASACL